MIQKPSVMDIQFLQNTPVSPHVLVALPQERKGLRFKPGPPFTLQVDKVAYESAGPLAYLKDLFKTLAA